MNLRRQVMHGGVYLALRQALATFIGFFGTLYVTRQIGPGSFGLFAACWGVYQYAISLGLCGLNVYLIRQPGELEEKKYHQVFSLFAVLGGTLALAGLGAATAWEAKSNMPGLAPIVYAVFLGLPFEMLLTVPLARLERNLDFPRVAVVEFTGGLAWQAVAVAGAMNGFGAWAPVAGYWAHLVVKATGVFAIARYRPRWHWDPPLIRELLTYGFGLSSSLWIWQARSLVNPLLVGPLLGAEAVGQVALSVRFVETLSFVKNATWRLSLAALARIQSDSAKLLQVISEGMRLQVMAVGVAFAGFAVAGPTLFGWLLGPKWQVSFELFPFIALGVLTNALFNMHASALYALRRNGEVALFCILHLALFAAGAAALVRWLGVSGFGWAEMVALPGYVLMQRYVRRDIGQPDYTAALWWYLPLTACLFCRQLGWWSLLALVPLLTRRATWTEIAELTKAFAKRPAQAA